MTQNRLLFLLVSNVFVALGVGEKIWKTCEVSEKDFMCPDWCARLNRYEKMYSQFRGLDGTKWQELIKYCVLFIIPASIIIYIWCKVRESIRVRREKLKRYRHRRKLKFLNRMENQRKELRIKQNYAEAPDSVRERPIRHGIIYSMQMNPELEKSYLEYRRKNFMEEIGNTTSRYTYYDRLTLPAEYKDLEFFSEDKCLEVKKIEKDPEFLDQAVALEYAINTPYVKGAKPKSAAEKALLKDHNL